MTRVNQDNDSAIVSIIPLTTRKQRRQFKHEALKLVEPLEEINTEFCWQIFNAPAYLDYSALYRYYHKRWVDRVNELAALKTFKLAAIDMLFFERNYKPQHKTRL